jgi:hypothetical protein
MFIDYFPVVIAFKEVPAMPDNLFSNVTVNAFVELLLILGFFGFVGQQLEDYLNAKYGDRWSPLYFVLGGAGLVILALIAWIKLPEFASTVLGIVLEIHWYIPASVLAGVTGFAIGLYRTPITTRALQLGGSHTGIVDYRSIQSRQASGRGFRR